MEHDATPLHSAHAPNAGRSEAPNVVLSLLNIRPEMKGVATLAENVLESHALIAQQGQTKLTVLWPSDLASKPSLADAAANCRSLINAQVIDFEMPSGKLVRLARSWLTARRFIKQQAESKTTLVWVDYSAPPVLPASTRLAVHTTDLKFLVHDEPARLSPQYMTRRLLLPRCAATADLVLPISETTTQEFRQRFPNASRVEPWPLYCRTAVRSEQTALTAHPLGDCRLLMVGSLAAHKRHDTALRALRLAVDSGADIQLRIVGANRGESARLQQLVAELALGDYVDFLGPVSDDRLGQELTSGGYFLQTSEYEGFGLGVIEAMRSGLSCILSDIPAHREVAQSSAQYFKAGDEHSLSVVLRKLPPNPIEFPLSDLAQRSPAEAAGQLATILASTVFQPLELKRPESTPIDPPAGSAGV